MDDTIKLSLSAYRGEDFVQLATIVRHAMNLHQIELTAIKLHFLIEK